MKEWAFSLHCIFFGQKYETTSQEKQILKDSYSSKGRAPRRERESLTDQTLCRATRLVVVSPTPLHLSNALMTLHFFFREFFFVALNLRGYWFEPKMYSGIT